MQPLVSVITPTWKRPRTVVNNAVGSVKSQTYLNIEHVVVIDGHDENTAESLNHAGYRRSGRHRYIELGQNWTGMYGDGSTGAVPRLVGSYLATGDIIMYLDDDNNWLPFHVENIVSVFKHTDAEVVLTGMAFGGPRNVQPKIGYVDTSGIAHKPSALKTANWTPGEGDCEDGRLVERWHEAGLKIELNPEPTVIYNGANKGRAMS